MKNQLLEDVGDSASHPVLQGAPARLEAPPAAAAPQVWRARAAAPRSPLVWRARTAAAPSPPAPSTTPAHLAFSSEQPDLDLRPAAPAPPTRAHWGRRVLGWTAACLVVGAAAGAGLWLYQDNQVVSSLALVADESPPRPPRTPWVAPQAEVPPAPPLVLMPAPAAAALPEKPSEKQPVQEPPARVDDNGDAAARAAADAVRRAEARRTAAARKDALRKEAARKEVARKEAARRDAVRKEVARKEAAPVATRDADPAAQHEETLRQCRAAGYHASQCIRRGCVATKFGLACRG